MKDFKPSIKEHAEKCYEKIATMGVISGTMKTLRIEEEKKMMEHEKDIGERDKLEFYKDKKLLHNGMKGYGMDYGNTNSNYFIGSKSSFPKTSSQAKIKKTTKKKKVAKKKKGGKD